MSQINALVELLANDPEIQALLDRIQAGGGAGTTPGFPGRDVARIGFPTNPSMIDPALFASEPGVGGAQTPFATPPLGTPSQLSIAEKTDLLSRGIGTDPSGVVFARGLGANPNAPTPQLGGQHLLELGAQRTADPAGFAAQLPSPIDPNFSVAGREQFLGGQREQVLGQQQATQQRIGQNQEQVQLNAQAAAQQGPVADVIRQLADAFDGEDRIPPISSSFIGAEPLEGAIPGSKTVFGVTAGSFTIAKFGTQEEADQARDTLRQALRQGPAPPPTLGLFGGVLSPFGRTGEQQFDDSRALSQEQRLTFQALEKAGLPVGKAFRAFGAGGGGRAAGRAVGGAGGDGRPFKTTRRAVALKGDRGFAFIDKIDELRTPGLPAGLAVTGREQELLDILNGELRGRSAGDINRLMRGAGDTIGRLFDEESISGDEALIAEIMRERLTGTARLPNEKPDRFEARLRRLMRQSPTFNETQDAADRLAVNPDDLDSQLLLQIQTERDELVQAQSDADRRFRADQRTTARFDERESPEQRVTRQDAEREDRRLERVDRDNQARKLRIATIAQAQITSGNRVRVDQLKQQMRQPLRDLARLRSQIAAENRKKPGRDFGAGVTGVSMIGGPDRAKIAEWEAEVEDIKLILDKLIEDQAILPPPDPRLPVLRSQTQPALR